MDETTGNCWILEQLEAAGAQVVLGEDPCTLAKACKNAAQLGGMRAAHVRDGVALLRFLHWFSESAPGAETEWTVAARLTEFRELDDMYRSPSFPTISATGPNSAHCHYIMEGDSFLSLHSNEIYLIDSGAQYLDGTTDITRTLIIGHATSEMRRRYTQVLKGHIAISTARFPQGTTGSQIDVLARQFLWRDGVDYDHGTGHGVGCYLSVHEGPHRISKRPSPTALLPGMVVSNEPGYYKAGHFGIRIENLLVVVKIEPPPEGAEHVLLCFETLSLAPYDRQLIEVSLLTADELAWVDTYHQRVRAELAPHVSGRVAAFLNRATDPLP